MKTFVSFFSLSLVCFVQSALAAPSDFNADGKSDITLVKVVGNSLRWSAHFSPTDPSATEIATLGKPGDHIALGEWTSSSTQPGILTLSSNSSAVIWKLDTGATLSFGTEDDLLFISGADFDGSGYTDAAYVARSGKKQVLHVRLDPFAPGGPGETKELIIGKLADEVFFLNSDGAKDRIAVLKTKSKKKSKIVVYDVITGSKSSFNVGNHTSVPLPLADSNGTDKYLVFAKQGSGKTKLQLRSALNGSSLESTTLPGKGTLIVGDYLSDPGEEIAIQTKSGFTIYSPETGSKTAVTTASDIAVDHININTFGGSGSGGNDGGNISPGLGTVCSKVINADSHYIYKTVVSDHINDPRQGGGSFIIAHGGINPSVSCLSVYDSEGNEITTYGFYYPPGSEWVARAYGKGLSCAGDENPLSVADEAHDNTGSYSGYFKLTGSTCIKIDDLRECVNSSQC